ncbi:MAG: hypothetical protein M5U07_04820 [Xanthobacteraceae bacterium]|nr:hypothetical protein [Xanthobacteraceae bacterium]PWB57589.1 MAG: hypothetical protein C3F17_20250 [Bradyrhizobiaceae bacterium]
MTRFRARLADFAFALIITLSLGAPVSADKGDPAGWSVATDPRKRAYLKFVEEADGPRTLLFACLRDTNMLGIYAAGLVDGAPRNALMSLQNGRAKYGLRGQTGVDEVTGHPVFAYQTDLDATALRYLQSELMPVLQGKGPIVVTIGEVKREVPVAGLAQPLRQFSAICFAR